MLSQLYSALTLSSQTNFLVAPPFFLTSSSSHVANVNSRIHMGGASNLPRPIISYLSTMSNLDFDIGAEVELYPAAFPLSIDNVPESRTRSGSWRLPPNLLGGRRHEVATTYHNSRDEVLMLLNCLSVVSTESSIACGWCDSMSCRAYSRARVA